MLYVIFFIVTIISHFQNLKKSNIVLIDGNPLKANFYDKNILEDASFIGIDAKYFVSECIVANLANLIFLHIKKI